MPICEQVFAVLYENVSPSQAVRNLMGREIGAEL
jgi:glycerol-3-phosphate dehydrogenase